MHTPDNLPRLGNVLSAPKRHPFATVVACCVLSLLHPGVRQNVADSIGGAASSLDEQWRRLFHPGYLGDGKYSSSSHMPPHGREAFQKFITTPSSSAPELVQPDLYYHDTAKDTETSGEK